MGTQQATGGDALKLCGASHAERIAMATIKKS